MFSPRIQVGQEKRRRPGYKEETSVIAASVRVIYTAAVYKRGERATALFFSCLSRFDNRGEASVLRGREDRVLRRNGQHPDGGARSTSGGEGKGRLLSPGFSREVGCRYWNDFLLVEDWEFRRWRRRGPVAEAKRTKVGVRGQGWPSGRRALLPFLGRSIGPERGILDRVSRGVAENGLGFRVTAKGVRGTGKVRMGRVDNWARAD